MCHSFRAAAQRSAERRAPTQEPFPLAAAGSRAGDGGPGSRVGEAERDRTATLLGDAAAAGYLDLAELDERLGATWTARTRAELDSVVADLPASLLRERSRREAALRARAAARAALRPHVASYVLVMLLLVGIWLAVGITAQAWYPWPIWPALGWGIGLAGHVRAASAGVPGRITA